jgi:hypothetical protein
MKEHTRTPFFCPCNLCLNGTYEKSPQIHLGRSVELRPTMKPVRLVPRIVPSIEATTSDTPIICASQTQNAIPEKSVR